MQANLMNLKILLPFKIFDVKSDVSSLTAETKQGSIGLLPHRLDFVAALTPGILSYEQNGIHKTTYVGLDEGIIIKSGLNVLISVRNAIGGTDLKQLRKIIVQDFLKRTEEEKKAKEAAAKMESRFVSGLARLHHERQ
jgi:F-type H+-transporting ATPase subunit epsilon